MPNNSQPKKPTSPKKKEGTKKPVRPFTIAGIGASAGGIEALGALLQKLSPRSGIAYIIIMHLSAEHGSRLDEVFQIKTKMKVHTAENGMPVQKDNVYIIPPGAYLQITDGHLALTAREQNKKFFHPIDEFFTSLASVYHNQAIGIVLSGTATDGTLGLKAIKGEGGITFAQDDSAVFPDMPHSAIDSGYVDFVLSPVQIARELSTIVQSPYLFKPPEDVINAYQAQLNEISNLIYESKQVNFSVYKSPTIYRRILRRVALHKIADIKNYVSLLKEDEKERDLLFNDLLINVTGFFRDKDVFTSLSKSVFPAIMQDRNKKDIIRIWVAACSTGEEAYSFAICLAQYMKENELHFPFQVFATDVNDWMIDKARKGIYTKASLSQLPDHIIKNYFIKIDEETFQVAKFLKDACVFAKHNLLSDPPFSRLDIVSCQNLLIYLEPQSQLKVLQSFHYALKPYSFLVLGRSESLGEASGLFESVHGPSRIFTKKDGLSHHPFNFSLSTYQPPTKRNKKKDFKMMPPLTRETDIEKENDRILLSRYVTPSVLVNKDLHIIRFNGNMTKYLQHSGKASFHLLKIIKDDFLIDLRSLIKAAKESGVPEKKEGIRFQESDMVHYMEIEVAPINSSASDPYFLILFKDLPYKESLKNKTAEKAKIPKIVHGPDYHKELTEAKEQIKQITNEFYISKEELQSANEEILSSNEELQSINEELNTSKEELQSSNEELITISDELTQRNAELKAAYEYREAIVQTIREPLIVLDTDMKVLTANQAFLKIFGLTERETRGFGFFEIANKGWDILALKDQLDEIISKKTNFRNFEIRHSFPGEGERVLLFNAVRMGNDPLKKNKIVLVIEDITERRRIEENLKNINEQNVNILNSITDLFIAIDNEFRLTFVNKEAERFIGLPMQEVINRNIWEVLPSFSGTAFSEYLIAASRSKKSKEFEFHVDRDDRWYNFRFFPAKDMVTIYADDITEYKRANELILQSKERYQTFISKSAEGIWRFELKQPVDIHVSPGEQLEALLEHTYLAECNDAIARRYGFSKADEILGDTMNDLFSGTSLVHYLPEFIKSGYRLTDVVVKEKVAGKRTYFLNNLVGIVEDNLLKRVWGTKRDITVQKETEKALKETQEKLKMSLSAGMVATWVWNIVDNKIEWTNELTGLYGLKICPEDCSFEDWLKMINSDDALALQHLLKEGLSEKKEISHEYRITWPDESVHWLLMKCTPHFDEMGNILELTGVHIDITDRKLLEMEREGFIAIASHELKTPLTSIKAYTEILYDKLMSKKYEETATLTKRMGAQIDRLQDLIKDLLDVSKIQEGQLELHPVYFDLNKLVNEVVEDMQNTTAAHTIINKVNIDQPVQADKNKIREVLINYVSNAIKYSPNADKIIIDAEIKNGKVIVSVQDFGIGLSKANQAKLFSRFYRVNDGGGNTFSGLGLGLYISAEILKRHNGKAWVESVKDEGSTFYFELPLPKD